MKETSPICGCLPLAAVFLTAAFFNSINSSRDESRGGSRENQRYTWMWLLLIKQEICGKGLPRLEGRYSGYRVRGPLGVGAAKGVA